MSIFLLRGEIIFYDFGEALPAERVPMAIAPASEKEASHKKDELTPHNYDTFLRWLSL